MKYFAFAVFCFACFAIANSQPPLTENEFIQQYLESLKQAGFNKDIIPEGNGGYGSPVEVRCSMYIINVHKVDDFGMDYAMEFYFRQSWNDSRLSYYDKDISEVILNDPQKIWVPDLFFVQEKQVIHHQIITPNTFIRISPSGEVLFSVRLTATFSCPMDFSKYPHDIQKCNFSAESYGRTTAKIEVEWIKNNPVSFDETIKTFDFQLTSVQEGSRRVTMNTNTYSTLQVIFTFKRLLGFYMLKLYIPYIFLVMIAFASFRIPAKKMALRLTLLLVILYLMVFIMTEISCYFPPTSYIKASDIWIAVCLSMVFAAFVEYIIVYLVDRSDYKSKVIDLEYIEATKSFKNRKGAYTWAERIDLMCGIIFSVLFVIFNFVYFLVY